MIKHRQITKPYKERNPLNGRKFGKWSVLYRSERKHHGILYVCKCDCGTIREVRKSELVAGVSRSCGCTKHDKCIQNRENYIGQKYNQLTVISFNRLSGSQPYFNCLCDCGNKTIVNVYNLKSGHTKSCGHLTFQSETPEKSFKQWLYGTYKKSAQTRNHEFKLTEIEFFEIIQQKCNYCGDPGIDLTDSWRNYKTNGGKTRRNDPNRFKLSIKWFDYHFYGHGIDRLDSNKGYILENSVSCCTMCNRMKMDHNLDKFLGQVSKIYKKRCI